MSTFIVDPAEGARDNKDAKPDSADLTESFFLGDWRIEPASRCAYNGAAEVKIDPRNMRVLQVLVERCGEVISQREIESLAWEGVVVTSDSLYQSIRQLRQALGDTKPPAPAKYIETVQRKGYRLVAKVRTEELTEKSQQSPQETADLKNAAVGWTVLCLCLAVTVFCIIVWIVAGAGWDLRTSETRDSIEALEPSPEMDVHTLRSIGLIERDKGRSEKALRFLQQALRKQTASAGERNQIVANILRDIASTQYWLGDDVEALASARRANSILRQLTPDTSPERIAALTLLAEILIGIGEYSEAEENVRLSVELADQHYGVGNPDSSKPMSMLAKLRHAQDKLPEAETAAREAVRLEIEARGANHHRVAYESTQLSAILIDMERYAEAEKEARQSIAALERSGAKDHPYFLSAQHVLSEALMNLGQLDEAETLLRSEFAELLAQGSADWRIGRAAIYLAGAMIRRGNVVEAERYVALAATKLDGAKGWPAERELRNLQRRRAELTSLRPDRKPDEMLSKSSSARE